MKRAPFRGVFSCQGRDVILATTPKSRGEGPRRRRERLFGLEDGRIKKMSGYHTTVSQVPSFYKSSIL